MSQGNLYIGVYGVNADGVKRTTSLLKYKVAQGALEGVKPTEPTPDIYEQILSKIADVAYPEVPVQSVNGKSGKVVLTPEDIGAQPAGNYIIGETDPTVPAWAKEATKPKYTAGEVGAEERGAMNTHNTSPDAHNDLRLLIEGLTLRFNAVFDSTDIDLDQMSEIVAYIKDNASLIESVTTSKVNVSDIVDNLTTNVKEKPLSAAQGVVLKDLIDKLQSAVNDKVGARHEHSATEITSGILPVSRGGTGMSTGQNPNAVINLNGEGDCFNALPTKSGALYATTDNGVPSFGTLPLAQGGTGATTAEMARASLGAAAATHSHSITELGDLSLASSTADGLMSASDKRKLDDLDTNLEAVSDLAREASTDVKEFREDFEPHISNKANPHSVTAEQVGALPLGGGTLTGTLTVNGGDGAGASKISLVPTQLGQITDHGTSTLFGFTNAGTLTIGHGSYNTQLRGKASRPTYNGSNIALQSDIPDIDTEGIYNSVAEAKSDVKDLREEVANLVNGAPEALNTLDEIAAALKDNAGIVDTLNEAIGKKANASDLTAHTGNTSNPHGVTAAQTGALPLAGGLMNGSVKFQASSLPQKNLEYICGIDAFASGGEMGWQSKSDFLAGCLTTGHAGTDGILPYRLRSCQDNPTLFTDPNSATATGFYYIYGGSNRPPFSQSTNVDYRVLTTAYSDQWLQQIATDFRCTDVFVRRRENGTWTSWLKLAYSSEISGLSDSVETACNNALEAKSDVKDMRESLATYETKSDASNKLLEAKAYTNSGVMSANSYTDTKISELINSAPTTLDTLGEIATAMQNNANVVTALEQSIGNKANSTHNHSAGDITSGVLPLANGGTGSAMSKTNNAIIRFSGSGNYFSQTPTKSGAMYATSANGAPTFGTLPIAQGGTGATDAATALSNLGGLSTSGGTLTGPITYPTASGNAIFSNYISAGGGYSPNTGKYGVKLICCDQVDCQTGLGQDLTALPGGYELSIAGGRNGNGDTGYISFAMHSVNSTSYDRLGYFDNGGNFYTKGQMYEGGTALSNKYLPASGGTLTDGSLALKPAAGEGGQILLEASTADRTNNGILLDTANGDFRIIGLGSADGTSRPGYGSVLQIDPYDKTILGGYSFDGTAEKAVSDGHGNNIASTFKDIREELAALAARIAALETAPVITFTIAGTAYTAEQGMTWGQWVYSKYNTAGAILTSDKRIQIGALVANNYGAGYQYDTYEIRAGAAYVISA